MAGIKVPVVPSPLRLKQTIRTFSNYLPVEGFDGNAAAGRVILLIGKTVFGTQEIKAQTITDSNGDFSFTLAAGVNDRFVVVAIGNNLHEEYTRALGDITGVV